MQISDRFQICNNCDNKLNCFYQFRIDSIRIQHEYNGKFIITTFYYLYHSSQTLFYLFKDILKSVETQPPQNVQYEQQYYAPINEENIYTDMYDHQAHQIQEFQPMYIGHDELHLALENDQNHSNNTIINIPTNNEHLFQQMHTPATENHHQIHEDEVDQSTPLIESDTQEAQILSTEAKEYREQKPTDDGIDNVLQNGDFTYDDFDESCQSFPNDRNNIDNVIDKKIEEFIQNKRNKANPKICTICNKLFRTNFKLREHMQTHENSQKFICDFPDCNKQFKSKIGLKEHAAKHTGEHNYICEVCSKKFLLRSYFMAHQKIHSKVKNFCCSLCQKKFKNKHNLINHENSHYGLKHFSCEVCQKAFTTKTNLDIHIKSSHTQIELLECDVCKKNFKTEAYLKVHKRTHFKELQNHICKICKKSFIQLSDLKIHLKTHEKQKDFVCEMYVRY